MKHLMYKYRYDIVGIGIMLMVIHIYFDYLLSPGMVVFSDIDFPYNSKDYLNQIVGVWNHRFNTTSMLNTPRLLSILPSYMVSALFGYEGAVFFKVFLFQNIYLACLSFYVLAKRVLRVYLNPQFTFLRILLLVSGSLYYGLNPWVIIRIQHIFLLVGYSLFPFVLLQFFKLFDHKFLAAIVVLETDIYKIKKKQVVDAMLLGLAISVSAGAIHYFFYTVFLFIALIGLLLAKYLIIYRNKGRRYRMMVLVSMIKKCVLMVGFIVGLSGFWFFVYIGSILLGTQATQNNINVLDTYSAFSQNSDLLSVVYGISYWWPMVPFDFFGIGFYISGGMILFLSFLGVSISIKHHHLILFMGLLGAVLILLATGVYYKEIAPIFLLFVRLPIIGSVFRDPNKLYGVFSICLGITSVVGASYILGKLEAMSSGLLIQVIAVFALFLVAIVYVAPMKDNYGMIFYNTVTEPEAYSEFQNVFGNDKNYTIYLPLSEEMLRQSRVATPFWNNKNDKVDKATGDVHIYNTPMSTLFHHEGNDLGVGYYLRYLQFLMDKEKTSYFEKYIEALGSLRLVYHKEYLEQEERQEDNITFLEQVEDLNKDYENNIFSVYSSELKINNIANQYIYTTQGFEAMELYNQLEGYHPLNTPVVFAYQDTNSENILASEISGIVDVSSKTELWMQFVDEEKYIYPFDWIQEGNPYIKWSKTYITSTDWHWYMTSQNFFDMDYNFDMNGGVATTFASKALDVLPHERKYIIGNKVMDFDTMLAKEVFFVADNPELFDVQANPYNNGNDIQTIHGTLVKGEPKDIWQVAKSGFIDALPGVPYQYELLMSGRFLDGMHMKVRFYDSNKNELGIAYVVSPEESMNFDTIKFYGEVITPKNTAWMRFDLMSFQKPEMKSFWWIHDVNVYELSAYSGDNRIGQEIVLGEESIGNEYSVYTRAYTSPKGGGHFLKVGEEVFYVDTYDVLNRFQWIKLGTFISEADSVTVELEADTGFNAVNTILLLNEEEIHKANERMVLAIENKSMLMTKELSLYLEGYEQLQSNRVDASLSYGQGIDLAEDSGYVMFDIIKPETYRISNGIRFNNKEATVSMTLLKDKEIYYEYELSLEDNPTMELYMEAGTYTIVYDVDSKTTNYGQVSNLEPFYGGDVFINQFIEDPFANDCSECEKITSDMMSHEVKAESIRIDYEPTCSCDWYIYSTPLIETEPGEEWYVTYNAMSEWIDKRHGKIIYLDDNNEPIGYQFINEVEEIYKSDLNHYEQIFEVPFGTNSMYLQFWARGNKEEKGYLYIDNLKLYRYEEFTTLDHLIVSSGEIHLMDSFKTVPLTKVSEGHVRYDVYKGEKAILNTFMSPNLYFSSSNDSLMFKLNGVTAGYVVEDSDIIALDAVLFKVYVGGLILFGMVILTSIAYLCFYKEKS